MFKESLIRYIQNEYNELNELKVNIDGKDISGTLYNLLTPYLAHKNTIDQNNRIIAFYTKEKSRQQKLLPLYIGLSNYYSTYNQIKSEFNEYSFESTEIESQLDNIFNSFPSEFKYLENKKWKPIELSIDIKRNNRIHLYIESIERHPQRIAPQLQNVLSYFKPYVDDLHSLEKSVISAQSNLNNFLENNDAFLRIKEIQAGSESKQSVNQILQLGSTINHKPAAGVLLFTNKTKYKRLIQDTLFNGVPIEENFSIAEVKINHSSQIQILKNKESVYPLVYLCSIDFYSGWKEIIEEIDEDYINTIVIDDFNEIVEKEKKLSYQYFREFANSIAEAQKNDDIKDVYFLDEDSNFENHQILTQYGLDPYPWLLNYYERQILFGQSPNLLSNHQTHSIKDELGSKYWENFKHVISTLGIIIKEEFNITVKAKYLSLVKEGFNFLSRATSFQSENFNREVVSHITSLREVERDIDSSSFGQRINNLEKAILESEKNSKLNCIIRIIKDESIHGKIIIASQNQNVDDQNYAKSFVQSKTNCQVKFISIEDVSSYILRYYDGLFCLNFSGKLTRTVFLHEYCKKQFLILNDRQESGYYKKCFWQFTPQIKDLSNFDNKLLLLNLEEQDSLVERRETNYKLNEYLIEELTENDAEIRSSVLEGGENEQDFSSVITDLLFTKEREKESLFHTQNSDLNEYLFYFDDGFLKSAGTKFFHVLLDEEKDEIHDFKKRASEVVVGDRLFIMQGFNDDFNELLAFLKKEFKPLDYHFDKANCWRIDLQNKYEELGGYIARLNRFLEKKGINVTNPTVERWVSGLTIVPDCLPSLIKVTSLFTNALTSKYSHQDIIVSTKWLARFRTQLHKQIFQYHIYKKYGMNQQINNLKMRGLIEKMDDVVKIKEVLMIEQN